MRQCSRKVLVIIIKRPLLPAFLCQAAGIVLRLAGAPPLLCGAAAVAGMFILFIRRKRMSRKFCFHIIFFILLFSAGYFSTLFHDTHDERLVEIPLREEQPAGFGGTVVKVSKGAYSDQVYLKACTIDGVRLANNMLLEMEEADFGRGDYIEGFGVFTTIETPENPGQFDLYGYYKALGYLYSVRVTEIDLHVPERNILILGIERVKKGLKEVYRQCCDGTEAGVFEAILLGDKTDMEESLKELFTDSGIGHILAISGLHVSLLGMGLYCLLRRAGAGYGICALSGGILVVLYGLLTGNSVSVVRAVIMFLCAVYAQVIGRTYDILSAVSLSGILILLYNPYQLCGCGFLLSFLAIAGIVVVSEGFGEGRLRKLSGGIAVSLATLPVMLWFYYEAPVYSAFLNLLVIPLMTVIMVSALSAGIAGLIWTGGGRFFAGITHYILCLFRFACRLTLELPESVYTPGRPKLWQIGAYGVLLLLFAERKVLIKRLQKLFSKQFIGRTSKKPPAGFFGRQGLRKAFSPLLGTAVLIAALSVLLYRDHGGLQIVFLSVGQGDGIYIELPDGTILCIDGGSSSRNGVYEKVMEPFFKYMGVKQIDYLFLTHNDSDHYSGWAEAALTGKIRVEHLVLNEKDYREYLEESRKAAETGEQAGRKNEEEADVIFVAMLLKEQGAAVESAPLGTKYVFGESEIISLNSPEGEDDNDSSLVLLLRCRSRSFLFTGDISGEREEEIGERLKLLGVDRIEILKVAHHGSKYSTTEGFLDMFTLSGAVISCGAKNVYGHPHEETLMRLGAAGAAVYSTAWQGALVFLYK